jgi:hypothetical protein
MAMQTPAEVHQLERKRNHKSVIAPGVGVSGPSGDGPERDQVGGVAPLSLPTFLRANIPSSPEWGEPSIATG